MLEKLYKVHNIIKGDGRITVEHISVKIVISHGSMQPIIKNELK